MLFGQDSDSECEEAPLGELLLSLFPLLKEEEKRRARELLSGYSQTIPRQPPG
jgi:hypothetical protein